ncbi:hypothetical protein OG594_09050 [Streptomyces sp. NBC_01214]|uniref:hypothetical protein n=1 Tax=Streptomyces sp. NBC_01214 TaxID=2903777 RepID=UPI00225C232F|nr:hypothetical protein [Streptomyces sp. NBC_01214]MCX4801797.1 hypothetical protein [Streptomyces sp. NBC_01214]
MRCRAVRRLRRQLGRRGTILSCYGIVWILYGFGQLVTPQPDQRGLKLALTLFPLDTWGWLWIVAGIIAIACAWAPPGRDAAGFAALVLIVLPWMATYLAAWITGDSPRGWVAAAIWMLICIPVMVVAGWPEAPRRKRADPPYEC